jgi:hypothetical protein
MVSPHPRGLATELLQLDLYIHPSRKIKFHERIDCFISRIDDVNNA